MKSKPAQSALPSAALMLSDPAHLIAWGLGAGLSPVAPGTVGSLLGVLIFLGVRDWSWAMYLGLVVILSLIGIWAAHRSARLLGNKDPGCIVIDEVAGVLLALWLVPPGWLWWVAGFVLFRVFDILKPWPIGLIDRRVAGGFGIMLDDLFAGAYAFVAVQLLNDAMPYLTQ